MKKSYVVIGMGRFGTSVAERLYELGNEVLAIDTNPDKVQRMESKVTCAVVADVRDEEVLRSLGARSCDCAVVAIGSDLATCIIATLNLKDLGVPQVICKATDELRKKALEMVKKACRTFPAYAVPKNIALTLDEWTIDNGLLTPTLKLKRSPMQARYGHLIEEMYKGAKKSRI